MSEEQFWIRIWSLVAGVIVAVIVAASACSWHSANVRAELIAKSADPMLATCAYYADADSSRAAPYCTIYLAGKNNDSSR